MDKEKGVNKDRKNSIGIIIALLLIAVIAFIGITYQTTIQSRKIGYVTLNPIDVTLSSDKGNHNVYVKITLGGKSKNLNKLNMEKAQQITKETIKQLDYESIKLEDGNDYIKRQVLLSLRKYFGNNIEQVNLDEILTDVVINKQTEQDDDTKKLPSREEYLKGLSWTKKK